MLEALLYYYLAEVTSSAELAISSILLSVVVFRITKPGTETYAVDLFNILSNFLYRLILRRIKLRLVRSHRHHGQKYLDSYREPETFTGGF
jgi:hypothetical protein